MLVASASTPNVSGNSEKRKFFLKIDRSQLQFYALAFCFWFASVFLFTGGFVDPKWLTDWQRWDSEWYIRIWNEGYFSSPLMSVFPPGYSWLVGPLSELVGSFNLAALIFNMVSLFAAGVMVSEFCQKRFQISGRAFFIFFLTLPTSFYAFSVYSDAFFLLVFWGALILACQDPEQMSRRQKWMAAVYMFFVPWVRLTGYALLIWTMFSRWFALAVLVTFSLLLYVNRLHFGDSFHFLHMQQKFLMPEGGFFRGLGEAWFTVFNNGNPFEMTDKQFHFWLQVAVLPLTSMCALFLVAGYFVVTGENLIALTIATVVIFSRNQAFWRSAFRYDWPLMALIAVPLLANWWNEKRVVILGREIPLIQILKKSTYVATILIFAILQIHLATRMHLGAWSF